MAHDPLSEVTRKTRRSVLATSSALILVRAFDVTVEDIPFLGLKIKFAEELLPTGIFVVMVYFTISFLIYALDDYLNLTPAEIERGIQENVTREYENIKEYCMSAIKSRLQRFNINYTGDDIRDIESRFLLSIESRDEGAPWLRGIINRLMERTKAERIQVSRSGEGIENTQDFDHLHNELLDTINYFQEQAVEHRNLIRAPLGGYRKFAQFRIYGLEFSLPVLVVIVALFGYFSPDTLKGLFESKSS